MKYNMLAAMGVVNLSLYAMVVLGKKGNKGQINREIF